jgi:predicted AAA+ superfamily ATPase
MDTTVIATFEKLSKRLIDNTSLAFRRDLYHTINFDARLVLLRGFRGVGKTTLLLQYVKEASTPDRAIFLSLEHMHFLTHTISNTIEYLYVVGYRTIILDEVHRYPTWSRELKYIYDHYPDLHILATSSSALDILSGEADLSRRADSYRMDGLSFREYLRYSHDIDIPAIAMSDMLSEHASIMDDYYDKYDLGKHLSTYLRKGYYPYHKEAGRKYSERLLAVLHQVIDVDLPSVYRIDYETARMVKRLLVVIARITPFTPNISKLSRDLGISRVSILSYLDYLDSADVITTLKSGRKSDAATTKPDKILLDNTNLLYALEAKPNVGTIRETFVTNALSRHMEVSIPAKGDLLVDQTYSVEIGGPNKTFKQLLDMPNPVLIKDGIIHGADGILPMWMIGLL